MIYSLLIVDDEEEIVDFLEDICTEVKEYEIEVYKAYSGREAIEILKKTKVDVVLSDVRMPDIDGLQLLDIIKEEWSRCKVIFLTGYREFDDIYTALGKGEVRYLLKTESDETICQNIIGAIHEIEKSNNDDEIIKKSKEHLLKMQPYLQQDLLRRLLNDIFPEGDLQNYFDELHIPIDTSLPISMIVGRLDKYLKSNRQNWDRTVTIEELFETGKPDEVNYAYTIMDDIYYVWMIQPKEKTENRIFKIQNVLEYIQDSCRAILNNTISFAYTNHYIRINEIFHEYNHLQRLLICKIGIGEEMLLSNDYEKVVDTPSGIIMDTEATFLEVQQSQYALLKEYLENGQEQLCFKLVQELCGKIITIRSKNFGPALEVYYNISMTLLNYINKCKIAEELAFKIGLYKLTHADEHKNWSEASEYLMQLITSIFDTMHKLETSRADHIIDTLKDYIDKNLGNDLTLVELADLVYFNPSYLSRLFKQEAGMKLSDYILNKRIERAKKYLIDTDMKITEISSVVGYDSTHSFSRVFREKTGYAPRDYRMNNILQ